MIEVNDANFDKEVLESDIPVLVDFWATWCQPCKMLLPVISEVSKQFDGKIKFVKVNLATDELKAEEYAVRAVPTLMFFKDGAQSATKIGSIKKQDLIDWLTKELE